MKIYNIFQKTCPQIPPKVVLYNRRGCQRKGTIIEYTYKAIAGAIAAIVIMIIIILCLMNNNIYEHKAYMPWHFFAR